MKTMNYSIIRCICALVLGVLLVAWPEAAILYLVITIGALFLVPGLFSVFGYLTRGKQNGMSFPIAGLGSLLFGLWLMIMPAFFVGILMYVLGAVLVLAGISQIVNLSAARSWTVVPGGFFVVPVLVLIAGVVVSHILLCVHDVILVSDSLYAGISIIGYANFTLFTSFGRDDKYTIRALSTINSGGGGIFQDRYALDIVRVDRVQRITVRSVERHSATRSARCVYDETIYYI